MQTYTGKGDASGLRIGIVVARFNEIVTKRFLDGAVETLMGCGADEADIEVAWVPGAFELGIAAKELAEAGRVHAVVCLAAVIRGATAHFDYVAGEAARGVASVHPATGVPATFGVVTTDTLEQALERAGGRYGNTGSHAAAAAVEMASLVSLIRKGRAPADHAAG